MKVKIAKTYWARLLGVIGRRLEKDEAFLIPHCTRVHSFFMTQPIELIYLDRANRILAIHTLSPWRISPLIKGTFSILEMVANGSNKYHIRIGDVLDISL